MVRVSITTPEKDKVLSVEMPIITLEVMVDNVKRLAEGHIVISALDNLKINLEHWGEYVN